MLIEINRPILERFVKDKEFMYQLVSNWVSETNNHNNWYGVGLHNKRKYLRLRPRGATQISITYEDRDADYWTTVERIEKRIVKYKGKR